MNIDQQDARRRDKEVFKELLESISHSPGVWRKDPLTAFASLKGSQDTCEFMVIGRAVNGWRPKEWLADDLKDLDKLSETLEDTFVPTRWFKGEPIKWVDRNWGSKKGTNTKKSAFWRVFRATVDRLGIDDVSKMCWSNLYKISPHSTGNPSTGLVKAQREHCIRMLRVEIEDWMPRRLLFLTGYSWAKPFIEGMGWVVEYRDPGGPVEAAGTTPEGNRFVVAPHPQGKREGVLVPAIVSQFGVE
jgi:hypothetical protein